MPRLPLIVILLMLCAAVRSMTPEAKRSFEAFEQRAESGDPEAMYRLSAILEKGFDTIAPDTARSLHLLHRAAEAGYAHAQNYLGFLFQEGNLLTADTDSATYWIRRAADAGDPRAAHNLAFMLLHQEQPQDSTAISYLTKAADAGLPQAITLLADLYAEGRGVAPDTLHATELYNRAIDAGFGDAELRLLNLRGPEWSRLAASQALPLAIDYYRRGAYIIAVELLRTIGPDESETARAYAMLGNAYSQGRGVQYDHARSLEYFKEAARLGNPSAQYILSETLEIFPDIFPEMDAESLRLEAAKAGIHDGATALRRLTE